MNTLKHEIRTKAEDSGASAVWRMWLVDNETCNQKFKRLLLPLVHDWADLREKYDSFHIQKVKYSLKFWIVVCSVRTEKSHSAHFSTSWQQRLLRKVCLICILSKGNASFFTSSICAFNVTKTTCPWTFIPTTSSLWKNQIINGESSLFLYWKLLWSSCFPGWQNLGN